MEKVIDETVCPYCGESNTLRLYFDKSTETETRLCDDCRGSYIVYWKQIPSKVVKTF